MDSIYDILQRFDAVTEDIGPEQRSVKQLPALFKPPQTSPQLSGPYPGQNATRGYLVGEGEEEIEKIEITFTPDDIEVVERAGKLVPDAKILPHIVDQYEKTVGIDREGDAKLELDLSSDDLSAIRYIIEKYGRKLDETGIFYHMIEQLERQQGMTEAATAEEIAEGDVVAFSKAGMTDVKDEQDYKDKRDKIYRLLSQAGVDAETKAAAREQLKTLELSARNAGIVAEAATTEDVLSSMKKKLGDYFQDVATAIRTDPDLKDREPQTIDQIKAVKTIRTDDGKEIKITGNEDDGFRISIRNREIKTPFKNLDEAVMACEMYCARRRMAEASADYVEEKRS